MNKKALIILGEPVSREFRNHGRTNDRVSFRRNGVSIGFASTKSGVPPVDPTTVGEDGSRIPTVQRFLDDPVSQSKLNNSKPISKFSFDAYDLVLLVGGHGVMWGFRDSVPLAKVNSRRDAGRAVVLWNAPATSPNPRISTYSTTITRPRHPASNLTSSDQTCRKLA